MAVAVILVVPTALTSKPLTCGVCSLPRSQNRMTAKPHAQAADEGRLKRSGRRPETQAGHYTQVLPSLVQRFYTSFPPEMASCLLQSWDDTATCAVFCGFPIPDRRPRDSRLP